MISDKKSRRAVLKAGIPAALVSVAASPVSAEAAVSAPRNADFYSGGKFQVEKAKEAYFAMMRRFQYPIPAVLRKDMWATDFGLGDFAHAGMAGIFWYNDKATSVFAHEIYLLPGQMIVEHGHEAAGDVKPKREAWHVRHGSICTFGEGSPTPGTCPVKLPASQARYITVGKHWKVVQEGEIDALGRATARHFMVAGAQGAIVSEYGTYHDGAGLRFTNPGVKF